MPCRYTVPDWHRYVKPMADAPPIVAACRLLVREGELAGDPRSIACTYWGHQPDCPVYDGPGARGQGAARPAAPPEAGDVAVAVDAVWPVRAPMARDSMRWILTGLGLLSIALLLWTLVLGVAVARGTAIVGDLIPVALVAATVSLLTHILATLRAWARR